MGKQSKYENVILRGRTVYARLPFAADGSRRRVALPWVKLKEEGRGVDAALKLGRDVLARLEDHLVKCAAPKWEIIAAIHDGTLAVQEVHSDLAHKDGVERLEERLKEGRASKHAAVEVAPLVDRWPAMPLENTIEPTPATRENRRSRMKAIAKRLPLIKDWTTDELQRVINPSGKGAEPVGIGSTQMTYLRDARLFCGWLISKGILTEDPTRGVTVQRDAKKKARCTDFSVLMKVHAALPAGPIRDGFGLMVATGAEPQTVSRVTAGDVKHDSQQVTLHGTKNEHRERTAFVESWYWPTLVKLAMNRRSSEQLIPVDRFQLADGVRKAVQRLRAEDPDLDLEADFRPYDARHSFAARYVKAGAVLKVVARQLGHKDERMVIALYGHFMVEPSGLAHLQNAAEAAAVNLRTPREGGGSRTDSQGTSSGLLTGAP